jgi:hypothetical protein
MFISALLLFLCTVNFHSYLPTSFIFCCSLITPRTLYFLSGFIYLLFEELIVVFLLIKMWLWIFCFLLCENELFIFEVYIIRYKMLDLNLLLFRNFNMPFMISWSLLLPLRQMVHLFKVVRLFFLLVVFKIFSVLGFQQVYYDVFSFIFLWILLAWIFLIILKLWIKRFLYRF